MHVLLLIFLSFPAQANKLTMCAYPESRGGVDYSSPNRMMNQFLLTYGRQVIHDHDNIPYIDQYGNPKEFPSHYTSTMGHTVIHLECAEPNKFNKWVSMTGQNNADLDKRLLLEEKIGLGVLFYNFPDGEILGDAENMLKLSTYKSSRGAKPRCMSFPLTQEACGEAREMAEFYTAFNSYLQRSKLDPGNERDLSQINHFGLIDPYQAFLKSRIHKKRKESASRNPELLIGGGCAPFAVGLMKAAGVYDASFLESRWRSPLTISKALINAKYLNRDQIKEFCRGDDEGFSKEGVEVKIAGAPLGSALGPLGDSWTRDGYGNCEVNMYDPNRIWEFLGKANECVEGNVGCDDPAIKDWLVKNEFKSCEPITFTSPSYTKVRGRGGSKGKTKIERITAREQNVATQICVAPAL